MFFLFLIVVLVDIVSRIYRILLEFKTEKIMGFHVTGYNKSGSDNKQVLYHVRNCEFIQEGTA